MAAPILSERDLNFMIYELFDAEGMTARERYSDHSRETFDASINTCLLYTSPSPRDRTRSRMPSSA